ncbi:cytochrome P450 [Hypoxylon trugodes]|uniref:cytochrome P450 n=1 Tax=Hypoxylon trugodes TaxID=326681 RepID=UPI00218DF8ED|nr:cytochrome P450 [Hypoxylon trugodes]KAI1384279.1 cytochrome P450 [Hypoxylon trugodes]
MPSILVLIVGGVAVTYIFLLSLLHFTQDAREPPSIGNTIPFLTPMWKMISNDKYNLPIYTLRMPGSRIYVINSTSLITSVQSQFRALSFPAIEANIAASVIGVNKATNDIIGHDVNIDGSYLMSFPKYVHSSLSAGAALDAMNRRSIQVISKSLDRWAKEGTKVIKLYEWVRHELLLATTEGVYGPKNPFRDPTMEKAWYTFEPSIMTFVLNLPSQIFAREGYKAREYMVGVWNQYFERGSYEQGSELIKTRVKINNDFGITLTETARIEIGGSQGILSNTLPGAFWMIYYIFSNPTILKDIKAELYKGVREDGDIYTIDLSYVKSSCPILLSTFKEMMRVKSSSSATRIAMEDHLLGGKYLLKKGSTIMMPAMVQHTDHSIWGDSVHEFNHLRFVRQPGAKRTNPVAFRGFGGGTTLCPGRHFASTEILMFSALMVLRFDLLPVDGKWTTPGTTKSPLVNALPVPDDDISVVMRPTSDKVWNVSFSGYDQGMEIVAEDIEDASS